MTHVPGKDTVSHRILGGLFASLIILVGRTLRCIAFVLRAAFKLLASLSVALGQAFQMAYVDPFADHDNKWR